MIYIAAGNYVQAFMCAQKNRLDMSMWKFIDEFWSDVEDVNNSVIWKTGSYSWHPRWSYVQLYCDAAMLPIIRKD